jgi:MFS family permease
LIQSRDSSDSRKNQRNLLRFHGDAAVSAVDEAAASYQAPSIIAAGANAQSVSLLTTLLNLGLSLICIKAPTIIERFGKTKKGAVMLAFLNLCAWVPLIFLFFLSPFGIQPMWFASLWLVNIMPGMLLSFQRDNWLSNIVPSEKLGRYLGQRLAIKSAFYLGAFCFLGYLLDSLGNNNLVNFGVIFGVAMAVALVDFLIFTFMHDPKEKGVNLPKPEIQQIKFGLLNFLGELKTKKLDAFIIFISLFYLSVGLSGPLYAVYMLGEKHFTYLSFTVIIAAEFLARVISTPFWGRFADKSGNIRVLNIVTRIIPVIPICWLFCSNVAYLAVVQIVSGICWGAFDLCTQNYVYKVAPQEKKLRYIVYTRCIILFSTALGGLASVYLLKSTFTIFGSQLLSIFLISGVFRVIIVLALMPKLIDLAVSYSSKTISPQIDIDTSGRAKVSKRGLFYHHHKPPAILDKRNTKALSPKIPSIIQQRIWTQYEKPVEIRKDSQRLEITPSRRPWFRDPEIFSDYATRNRQQLMDMMTNNQPKAIARNGLFYHDEGWVNYKKESLQSALKESRRWKEMSNLKPVYVEIEPSGVPGGTRTHDLLLRRQPLYPAELQGR